MLDPDSGASFYSKANEYKRLIQSIHTVSERVVFLVISILLYPFVIVVLDVRFYIEYETVCRHGPRFENKRPKEVPLGLS